MYSFNEGKSYTGDSEYLMVENLFNAGILKGTSQIVTLKTTASEEGTNAFSHLVRGGTVLNEYLKTEQVPSFGCCPTYREIYRNVFGE